MLRSIVRLHCGFKCPHTCCLSCLPDLKFTQLNMYLSLSSPRVMQASSSASRRCVLRCTMFYCRGLCNRCALLKERCLGLVGRICVHSLARWTFFKSQGTPNYRIQAFPSLLRTLCRSPIKCGEFATRICRRLEACLSTRRSQAV